MGIVDLTERIPCFLFVLCMYMCFSFFLYVPVCVCICMGVCFREKMKLRRGVLEDLGEGKEYDESILYENI